MTFRILSLNNFPIDREIQVKLVPWLSFRKQVRIHTSRSRYHEATFSVAKTTFNSTHFPINIERSNGIDRRLIASGSVVRVYSFERIKNTHTQKQPSLVRWSSPNPSSYRELLRSIIDRNFVSPLRCSRRVEIIDIYAATRGTPFKILRDVSQRGFIRSVREGRPVFAPLFVGKASKKRASQRIERRNVVETASETDRRRTKP